MENPTSSSFNGGKLLGKKGPKLFLSIKLHVIAKGQKKTKRRNAHFQKNLATLN